jgi:hypothetical protein
MAEALDDLVSDRLGPDGINEIRKVASNRSADDVEKPIRKGIHGTNSQIAVQEIDAERGLVEEGLELLGAAAQVLLCVLAHASHLQMSLHAGQQFAGAERLDEVVVGAVLYAFDAGLLPRARKAR